jgi:hypothetical protein
MADVYDESWILQHWVDAEGNIVNMGTIHIDGEDILSMIPIEEWDPSDEEFEGYTGNAGMTLDRWYHRAAIVLCPDEKEMNIFLNEGTDAGIGGLQQWIKRWKSANKVEKKNFHSEAVTMAEEVMKRWESKPWASNNKTRSIFSDLILELKELNLVQQYFEAILPVDMASWPSLHFLKSMNFKKMDSCRGPILKMFKATQVESFRRNIEILYGMSKVNRINQNQIDLLSSCSKQLRLFFKEHDIKKLNSDSLILWCNALIKINAYKEFKLLMKWITKEDCADDLSIPSLLKISIPTEKNHSCIDVLKTWLDIEIKVLKKKTNTSPEPYMDWKRSPFTGNSSDLYHHLNRFLTSPKKFNYELKAPQNIRTDVENQIAKEKIDLDGQTIKKGSPHTLILKKNNNSYDHACEIHKQNLKKLKTLLLQRQKTFL